MAKRAYVGIADVARRVKKGYFGVDGIARKIKKGYIGIGGVARPCWSTDMAFFGAITPLSAARGHLSGQNAGDYALFAGGTNGQEHLATVDAYSKTLARSTPTALSVGRSQMASAKIGGNALFFCGFGGSAGLSNVDAYSGTLVRSTPNAAGLCYNPAATAIGGYAICAGGRNGTYFNQYAHVYNGDLVKGSVLSMEEARDLLAATAVGNHALFCGGRNLASVEGDVYTNTVDAYSSTLVHSTPSALSVARGYLSAASVGNYALFGVGRVGNSSYPTWGDVYNGALVRTTLNTFPQSYEPHSAVSIGDYAFFMSTYSASTSATYNANLIRMPVESNTITKTDYAMAVVGGYALTGGGLDYSSNDYDAKVYAFEA